MLKSQHAVPRRLFRNSANAQLHKEARVAYALALFAPVSDVRIRLTGAGIAARNASSTESQT